MIFSYINSAKEDDFEEFGPEFYRNLLVDDQSLFSWSLSQIQEIMKQHRRFQVAILALHKMQGLFDTPTLKKPLRTLYGMGLSGALASDNHVFMCISLFKYHFLV